MYCFIWHKMKLVCKCTKHHEGGWFFFEIAKSRTVTRTQQKVHSSSWQRDVLCQLWRHCSALLSPHLTHAH